MVTLADIQKNEDIKALISAGNRYLAAMGFTEHGRIFLCGGHPVPVPAAGGALGLLGGGYSGSAELFAARGGAGGDCRVGA